MGQRTKNDLYLFYVDCVFTFSSVHRFERYTVVFLNALVKQTGDVYKNFLTGIVVFNETIAFGYIEELYCACLHVNSEIEMEHLSKDKNIVQFLSINFCTKKHSTRK